MRGSHVVQATGRRWAHSTWAPLLVLTLLLWPGLARAEQDAAWVGALVPGARVYVTDDATRLRAKPSVSAHVLTGLERGRWLEIVSVGSPHSLRGLTAPWVELFDPWAPEADSPFTAPTSGWAWGGLVRPTAPDLPGPSVANWERVILRVDPWTRELALGGGDGDAVAWAVHFQPAAEGAPREIELAEWLRVGAAPSRAWKLEGWRRLGSLTVLSVAPGVTWLRLDGEGSDGGPRMHLRASLLDLPPCDVDSLEPEHVGRRRVSALSADLDGDGAQEFVSLVQLDDGDGVVQRRRIDHRTLTATGARLVAKPEWRSALLPAPDLRVTTLSLAPGPPPELVIGVASKGAGAEATQILVTLWGERVVAGQTHRSERTRLRLPLEALVPSRIEEIQVALPSALASWPWLGVEVTLVPVEAETSIDDNQVRSVLPMR